MGSRRSGRRTCLRCAREPAADAGVRKVVLVEGDGDLAALEALADRRGPRLDAKGVSVLPLGGAMSIRRFLALRGPGGLDVTVPGHQRSRFRGWWLRGGAGKLHRRS
ncbi:TOPRIM nucleotidyl transferase/hydrolase domain-containing protein [Streptomyces sp. NPDC048473]|uniref:TOPRIM nucleotidyl transferase/hydrolase domain-containing protein n=1 Tax=unclassified Streptomyces TaxID=2593676 RepID=UPI003717D8BE